MDGRLNTYRTIDTLGKSPLDLVLQVYDGAITAFRAAADSYRENSYEKGHEAMQRARKFLVHLYTTLDKEKGQDIARSLEKLYTYLICQIDVAQATKDQDIIASNIKILENLKSGWKGLKDQKAEGKPAPSAAAAPAAGGFTISG
ncbi:MAG: flagellar export chaperone FliS [candidate division Zixibacteria bacterium]|jgi:flagellar protein FliS|nr:flagellar export chaperone FliS [candidate division Zixibacteria bacterium]